MAKDKKQRSKRDKIAQVLTLTLGGEEVTVPVKPMRHMGEYQKNVQAWVKVLLDKYQDDLTALAKDQDAANPDGLDVSVSREDIVGSILPKILEFAMSDAITFCDDLLWGYAPDLKEDYDPIASDGEVILAAVALLEIVCPLPLLLARGEIPNPFRQKSKSDEPKKPTPSGPSPTS